VTRAVGAIGAKERALLSLHRGLARVGGWATYCGQAPEAGSTPSGSVTARVPDPKADGSVGSAEACAVGVAAVGGGDGLTAILGPSVTPGDCREGRTVRLTDKDAANELEGEADLLWEVDASVEMLMLLETVAVGVMLAETDADTVVDLVLEKLEEMLPLFEVDAEGVAVKEADAVRDELDDGEKRDGASQQAEKVAVQGISFILPRNATHSSSPLRLIGSPGGHKAWPAALIMYEVLAPLCHAQ